jgi:hypothetical protein
MLVPGVRGRSRRGRPRRTTAEGQNDVLLVVRPNLGAGLVDIELDIDPGGSTAAATVNGEVLGTFPFTRIPANLDRFATVTPYATAAEFDLARIETCE